MRSALFVGIFTGGDPVADRVIAVGDALDGSTVSGLDPLSFASSLNNAGQIAFLVFLADGRTGVYRADPVRGDRGVTSSNACEAHLYLFEFTAKL